MKLYYEGFGFHDLGRVQIAGESGEGEPPEAPVRWRRRLKVRVTTEQPNFRDNRGLIEEARRALRQSRGRLRWEDDSGHVFLDLDVTHPGHGLPDEPNEWGQYSQTIEIEFQWLDLSGDPGNQDCTFQPSGAASSVAMGKVEKIAESVGWSRVQADKDHRESGAGRIDLRGAFHCADPSASQSARRASLLAQKDALLNALRSKASGSLRYGTTTRAVRTDSFAAELDQEDRRVVWAAAFSWVDFPNQAGHALARFTAVTATDSESGQVTLALNGTIAADTEDRARAKLDALRIAVAPSVTWAPVSRDVSLESADDVLAGTTGGDGATFLKLGFNDRYRKVTGDVLHWELRREDADEATAGLLRTTYSGFVLARGSTDDAAYNAAVMKARELGDRKYQFRVQSRETRADTPRQDGDHQARVDFSYEYRRAGARIYVEMTATLARPTFGPDTERVQGRIVGPSASVSQTYSEIKAAMIGLLRDEQTGTSSAQIQQMNLTTGTLGLAREALVQEFSFSFELARTKSSVGMTYSIEVDVDYQARKRLTTVQGSVFAPSQSEATGYLDAFITGLSLGSKTRSRRSTSGERGPAISGGGVVEAFRGLDFTDTYEGVVTGTAAILEASLTEEIRPSSPRRVVQPTAATYDVVQTCGIQSGTRTVRGRVVALNETDGIAWAKRNRSLPYLNPQPQGVYPVAPEITIETGFLSQTDGVARAGAYGAFGEMEKTGISVVIVTFTFQDIVQNYDPLG